MTNTNILKKIKKKIPTADNTAPTTDVSSRDLIEEQTSGEQSDSANKNDGKSNQQDEQSGAGNNTDKQPESTNSDKSQGNHEGDNSGQTDTDAETGGQGQPEKDNSDSTSDGSDAENGNTKHTDGDSQQNGDEDGTDSTSEGSNSENGDGEHNNTDSEQQGNESGNITGDPDATVERPDAGNDTFEPDKDTLDRERSQVESESERRQNRLENAHEEFEQFQRAMGNTSSPSHSDGGDTDISNMQFNINPDPTADRDRWKKASDGYKSVATLLEDKLKDARRDDRSRGKRTGRPDNTQLHRLQTNQLNVMQQRVPGSDKEYAVIVVLDRSGSMGGKRIDMAERAVVKYGLAMEYLGIDVCVMDLYANTPRITSPFNISIEDSQGDLLTQKTAGGTPLRKVIPIARERMMNTGKIPIIISVTDGLPSKGRLYINELEKCPMDVFGITVRPNMNSKPSNTRNNIEQYYDEHTFAISIDDLLHELEEFTLELPIDDSNQLTV